MSSISYAAKDSATMLRRDFRHSLRSPMMTVSGLSVPVFLLLLFVGVFGGAMSTALRTSGGKTSYIDYLAPGIILMAVGSGSAATAINVCIDMNEGIIARLRTMAISRASVLTGQVAGSMVRTMISIAAVLGITVALGFRPTADVAQLCAAVGVIAMLTLALTWLTIAFGLLTKSPAGANGLSLIPQFLPFISSAFVPTNSMPAGVRWFAENQPFTPVIETLRGLLTGTPIGSDAVIAVAWCAGISLAGFLWARALFDRDPAR
jgi:ABC-2 type transport system permease protein